MNGGDGRLDYGVDSDTLPVPNDFEATPLHDVTAMFGSDFAAVLPQQPVGHWVGPIKSGYGLHLVLVRAWHLPGKPPELALIRDQVLREFQSDRRVEANQQAYENMRAKYVISVQLPVEPRRLAVAQQCRSRRTAGDFPVQCVGPLFTVLLVAVLFALRTASAHEARPGYLELNETAQGR